LRKINGKTNKTVELDEVLDFIPDEGSDILNKLLVKESVMEIKEAIKALPSHEKDVAYLYLIYAHRHDEISKMLDISEGASKMRLHRAKKAIMSILEGENHNR